MQSGGDAELAPGYDRTGLQPATSPARTVMHLVDFATSEALSQIEALGQIGDIAMQTQRSESGRTKRTIWLSGIIVATNVVAISGCVERKETIRIWPSGAVSMALEYTADPGDFDTPVAFPSAKSGWSVDRRSEFDNEGKEKVILTASRQFAPREALPSNFAAKGDRDASLYLQFPTTIRVEQREDGTFMHFKRVYQPRTWAQVEYWRDRLIGDDIKKLGDKQLADLSIEEKARIVRALATFELFKHMELAKSAIEKLGDRIPQDTWLRTRMILTGQYKDMDWEAFVAQFEADASKGTAGAADESGASADSSKTAKSNDASGEGTKDGADEAAEDHAERVARYDAAAKNLLRETMQVAVAELRTTANLDKSQMDMLHTEFMRAQKAYDITDALGAHSFQIKVIMPGKVVGHNGDKIDGDDGGIIWEFDGEGFRDRSFELAATVKLAGGPSGQ